MSRSLPGTGLTALVLGGSSIARRRVVPAFDRLGVTVDIASRTAGWPAARSGPGVTFTDYADALARSRASLVYVSTRNHEHVEWTGAALAAGRADKALGHFEHIVQLQPDNVAALQLVAESYAAMGRFDQATRIAQQALARASAAKNDVAAREIRQRMLQYEQQTEP